MSGELPLVPKTDRRRWRRMSTSLVATVNYGPVLLPCFVADVSLGGAKIKLMEPMKLPPGPVVLECSRFGAVKAELVWQKGLFAGLAFADPADFAERLKALKAGSVSAPRIFAQPAMPPAATSAPVQPDPPTPYPSIRKELTERQLESVT